MITVSVVIPAYNAEHHIGDALTSIQHQTLHNLEVLVIDDGSTDNTLHEINRFADSLNLTILRQANAGPAAARNTGIRNARGRYCAFLDADDVMLPERLSLQAQLLDAEPDLGLVHTDLMTFDEQGIIHRTRHAFSDPCGGMVIDRLLLDNFITTSTVMAPRDKLFEAGLFKEARRVSEDFELWLQMATRWKIGFIDTPLVQYRRRPGSLSDDKLATARAALEVVEAFWQEHTEYRKKHPEIWHKSLAHHLTTAGSAALNCGEQSIAFAYLFRSLAQSPREIRSWKWLAKAILYPIRQRSGKTVRNSKGTKL